MSNSKVKHLTGLAQSAASYSTNSRDFQYQASAPAISAGAKITRHGSAKFEYWFPAWFLRLVVAASGTWSDLNGIGGSWSLRIPETISNNGIFSLIQHIDSPTKVEQFMTTYRISPRAIDESGDAILFVSAIPQTSGKQFEGPLLFEFSKKWHLLNASYSFCACSMRLDTSGSAYARCS